MSRLLKLNIEEEQGIVQKTLRIPADLYKDIDLLLTEANIDSFNKGCVELWRLEVDEWKKSKAETLKESSKVGKETKKESKGKTKKNQGKTNKKEHKTETKDHSLDDSVSETNHEKKTE